jgi:hypothetical protein
MSHCKPPKKHHDHCKPRRKKHCHKYEPPQHHGCKKHHGGHGGGPGGGHGGPGGGPIRLP